MKPRSQLVRPILLICTLLGAGSACGQTERSLISLQKDTWKKELQRDGILHYSPVSKYRLGVPLASFGQDGPKLLFTYAPRLPGGQHRKVFLIYLQMEID